MLTKQSLESEIVKFLSEIESEIQAIDSQIEDVTNVVDRELGPLMKAHIGKLKSLNDKNDLKSEFKRKHIDTLVAQKRDSLKTAKTKLLSLKNEITQKLFSNNLNSFQH